MVRWLFSLLIGVATGVISGFGIGGGSLLVLYLTAFAGVAQHTAGGMNLLYFIGCAPASLIGHIRQRNIDVRIALLCGAAGIAAAIPAALLAARLDTVTREKVAAAARKLELDTVYFLKGKEQ